MPRERERGADVLTLVGVLLFFAGLAYVIAPFSRQPGRVLVPRGAGLDGVQETLLIGTGVDRLLAKPVSYYDTGILYPDHDQLRSTEPFLGFALLGVPLRLFLRLDDVTVFQSLRWIVAFASLVYAWLFFRAVGLDVVLAASGAGLAVAQPIVLGSIERLQFLSVPLIFAVLYHGLMVLRGARPRVGHAVALFACAALYPLCGMINAMACGVAAIVALPWIGRRLIDLWRSRRATPLLVPLALAAAADLAVLAPWWRDRSDLRPYARADFLQVKNWNGTAAPMGLHDLWTFLAGHVGPGLLVALAVGAAAALWRRGEAGRPTVVARPHAPGYLLVMLLYAIGLVALYPVDVANRVFPEAAFGFQIVCYATLAWYWRDQLTGPRRGGEGSVLALAPGLGLFLCLLSFGPATTSNDSPVATDLMTRLISAVPPLASLRDFDRIWMFGVLALSVYAVVSLGSRLRTGSGSGRVAAAAIVVAVGLSVHGRTLEASDAVTAPEDFVQFASHSGRSGAIYVHPLMRWNSMSGVRMIAIARALHRPIVDGYLGIEPPWFSYATIVLGRFPDAESMWLLRRWHVETVLDLESGVPSAVPTGADAAFTSPFGTIFEVEPGPEDPHPSQGGVPGTTGLRRSEAAWSPAGGGRIAIEVPAGFVTTAIEVHFAPTVVRPIPEAIDVYAAGDPGRTRLNDGRSGEWLQSLAADAWLHRRAPVAAIRLRGVRSGDLDLQARGGGDLPVARIVLEGR